MTTTRIALVGAGRMGEVHARIIAEHPGADLAAVIDPNEASGQAVATRYDTTWTPNLADIANDTTIAAYVVAVPDRLHVDIACSLLEADRHVLLEKPIADTLEGALAIAQAARRSAGRITVGHVLRHDPRFRIAAQTVGAGGIGEPVHMRSARTVPRTVGFANDGQSPIYMYQGIHDIDLVQWISGQPITRVCAATAAKVLPAYEAPGDDVALILCRLANGSLATLEISWVLPETTPAPLYSIFEIYGTSGALTVDVSDQGIHHITDGGFSLIDSSLGPIIDDQLQGIVRTQFDHFLGAITKDRPFLMDLGDAVAAAAVLDAIGESLATSNWAEVVDYRSTGL